MTYCEYNGIGLVEEGDSNEVSDEGVPCALPLEDLPLAIVVSPGTVRIKWRTDFGVGGDAFAPLVRA